MPYTGEIAAANLPWLQDKVAGMNKRAAKLQVPAMQLNVLLGKFSLRKDPLTRELRVVDRRLDVELVGEVVKLAGWKLLGVIEHLAGGDVLLGSIPEQFRGRGAVCDHCESKRQRTLTCILQHEDGRLVQIGRSCVRDFLGCDPQNLLHWAWFSGSLEPTEKEAGRCREFVTVHAFTVACAVAIRLYGWHKADTQGPDASPTSYTAFGLLRRWDGGDCRADPLREEEKPTADDEKRAAKAINWITELPAAEALRSSYIANLQAVVTSGALTSRRCYGLAASLLVAHQNSLNNRQPNHSAPVASTTPASAWVGVEGERREFELTCTRLVSVASDFGECTLCMFKDAAGNSFKWFASAKITFEQGDKLTLCGTVKGHDEYKGSKQTALTRCKVLAVQTASA